MTTVKNLEAARSAAYEAASVIERELRAEKARLIAVHVEPLREKLAQEMSLVDSVLINTFAERRKAANEAIIAAEAALHAALVEAARTRPEVGMKVCDWVYGRWNRIVRRGDRVGIVEVCKPDTNFSENLGRYRRPRVGELFVRLLKKNGEPGKQIALVAEHFPVWLSGEKFSPDSVPGGWYPVGFDPRAEVQS